MENKSFFFLRGSISLFFLGLSCFLQASTLQCGGAG